MTEPKIIICPILSKIWDGMDPQEFNQKYHGFLCPCPECLEGKDKEEVET